MEEGDRNLLDRLEGCEIPLSVEESKFSGYNETTTVAFCDLHPELMSKHLMRLYYSPERREHADAKTRFIEPDLAPLPKYCRD